MRSTHGRGLRATVSCRREVVVHVARSGPRRAGGAASDERYGGPSTSGEGIVPKCGGSPPLGSEDDHRRRFERDDAPHSPVARRDLSVRPQARHGNCWG